MASKKRLTPSGKTAFATAPLAVLLVVIGFSATPAGAADRCVLVEDFTATWCPPCRPSGEELSRLFDKYAGELALVQFHMSDGYETSWGNQRATFYGVTAIPTVVFDGVTRLVGYPSSPPYETVFNTRTATSTDVTIDLYGQQVSGQTYRITTRVGIESGGQAKTMRVYAVVVLDYHPPYTYYRTCFMQRVSSAAVTLQPGESQIIEDDVTFKATSWASKDNIKIIAWAREPGSPWPKEVHQAAIMDWPLPPIGDVDRDGKVDAQDLTLLLAAWMSKPGDPNWNRNADFDGDNLVGAQDLTLLLANWHYGLP